MYKCFLSYSFEYRHIMVAIKGMLEVLGFDIQPVEGPDDQRSPKEVVRERILESDCVVVLFGPKEKPKGNEKNLRPAKWPYDEALFACGRKPITLILHKGIEEIPEFLKDEQSSPRFNFWDDASFREQVSHVLRHLFNFRQRVEGQAGNREFRYRHVECHTRIQSKDILYADWYNEVVAEQRIDHFHHTLKPLTDNHLHATMDCIKNKKYELEATLPKPSKHDLSIEYFKEGPQECEYLVKVEPALKVGEVLGYRRRFILPNWYPLTRNEIKAALDARSLDGKFPRALFNERFFGGSISFPHPAESVVFAIHFPRSLIKLEDYSVVVIDRLSPHENVDETARCKHYLKLVDDPASPELILELKLPRPLVGYRYYLQYEISE